MSDLTQPPFVNRHLTAISRPGLSKPIQSLLRTGLFDQQKSLFDFGCGRGGDVELLREAGFTATGWDPIHFPSEGKVTADVVNLGFVLNVIEDPLERKSVLKEAFSLARSCLCVATLVENQQTAVNIRPFGDGFITSRNTFQKYYSQSELADLLDEVLNRPIAALGLGIFVVFAHQEQAEAFLLGRTRARTDWGGLGVRIQWTNQDRDRMRKDKFFSEYSELLETYWDATIERGRFPTADEFPNAASLFEKVSPRRIQMWLVDRFGTKVFEQALQRTRENLIVYLALRHLQKKLPVRELPISIQRDLQATFPSFGQAWETSRSYLFQIGKPAVVTALCNEVTFGRLDAQALYVGPKMVDSLPVVLRIYVQTAELFFGDRFEADEIKLHKESGKVSFLTYFEPKAEKRTWLRAKVNLASQRIDYFDHSEHNN